MRGGSIYQRELWRERDQRRAAAAAPSTTTTNEEPGNRQPRIQFVTDEPCAYCGNSSDRFHPGGVVSQRWHCPSCLRWQPEADPRPAKVITEAEGYGFQRPFDPSGLDVLEAPELISEDEAI